MTSLRGLFLSALMVSLLSPAAMAAPILAPPGADYNESLASLADGYQRQQDVFATREIGISLDVFVKPEEIDGVKAFFAQKSELDFQSFSGKHPFEVVSTFEEYGDEGNFAGVASVGVAARLLVLKAQNAPETEIATARDAAIGAAQAWRVYGSIGGPGIVARGIRRTSPLVPGDPTLPGQLPELVPLKDDNGMPLPAEKTGVWRAAVAPDMDGWIWLDDTSKDQVIGFVLASAWLWDALHDDPNSPAGLADDLAENLRAFAKELMKVAPEHNLDLCIRDADGRLVHFHDLNAKLLAPDSVIPDGLKFSNGFNAAMSMAIIRAAYHVTGDEEIGRYYYEELITNRDYPKAMNETAGVIFLGASTNYSNVNMLAMSLLTIARFETDEKVRATLYDTFDHQFWDTGNDRDVSHVEQAWFDVIYGASSPSAPATIPDRVVKNLGGFQPAPAFQRDRVNCDDAEIAAKLCVAIDGTTQITLLGAVGHNDGLVAKDIVPMNVRPDSDFAWRSDPHSVNGGASNLMDPGGDYLAAYWLARLTELASPNDNISPFARDPLSTTPQGGAGGTGTGGSSGQGAGGAGGSGASSGIGGTGGSAPASGSGSNDDSGGCGCGMIGKTGTAYSHSILLAIGAALLKLRHKRRGIVNSQSFVVNR